MLASAPSSAGLPHSPRDGAGEDHDEMVIQWMPTTLGAPEQRPTVRIARDVLITVRREVERSPSAFGFLLGRRVGPEGRETLITHTFTDWSIRTWRAMPDELARARDLAALEARHLRCDVVGFYGRFGCAAPPTHADSMPRLSMDGHPPYILVHIPDAEAGDAGGLFSPARGADGERLTPLPFLEAITRYGGASSEWPSSAVTWSNYAGTYQSMSRDGAKGHARGSAVDRGPAAANGAGNDPGAAAGAASGAAADEAAPAAVGVPVVREGRDGAAPVVVSLVQSRKGQALGAPHPRRRRRAVPQPAAAPEDGGALLREYLRVLRVHYRLILGTMGVTIVGVLVGTLIRGPIYRANGVIEIRQQGVELVSSAASGPANRVSEQHLQTQYGILRSPALARRVAAELASAGAIPGTSPRDEAAVQRAAAQIHEGLSVNPVPGSQLVQVSYEGSGRALSARIVNSTFANYVKLRTEMGHAAASGLNQQLATTRAALSAAENRLQAYARQNGLALTTAGGGVVEMSQDRLRALQQAETEAETDRYQKAARYEMVQAQGAAVLDNEVLRALSLRVAELRSEYGRLRSTFTDDYPQVRLVRTQLDALDGQLQRERARASEAVRRDYLGALRREEMLKGALAEQRQAADTVAGLMPTFRVLQREVEGHQQLYEAMLQRQKAAEAGAALAALEVAVVDTALVPDRPVSTTGSTLQLAAVLGLLFGVALAFLREWTRTSVGSMAEVGSLTHAPILAAIPSATSSRPAGLRPAPPPSTRAVLLRSNSGSLALPPGDPGRPDDATWVMNVAESFSALRSSLLLRITAGSTRVLLVTSVMAREGKTTVAVNLSLSLTRIRRSVLLIDADLRRSAVASALGLAAGPGLVDVLEGRASAEQAVQAGPVPRLSVMTAGSNSHDAAELLSSELMRSLVARMREQYDFVVIDAPAVLLNVADARILADLVDDVVVVARSGSTPREGLVRAMAQLHNVIGVVLNDVDPRVFPESYWDYASGPRVSRSGD